jgi:hypothetical protein
MRCDANGLLTRSDADSEAWKEVYIMYASTAADYSEPIPLFTAAQDHNVYHTQDQEPDTQMIPTDRPKIMNHTAQVSEEHSAPRDSEGLTPSNQSQRDVPPSASEPHNIALALDYGQRSVPGHDTDGSHEDEHQQNSHRGQPSEFAVDSVRVSHMNTSPSAALMTDTMSLGS